jgi:hypothetical protein
MLRLTRGKDGGSPPSRRVQQPAATLRNNNLKNHIKICAVCQGEGKKAWEVDERPIIS